MSAAAVVDKRNSKSADKDESEEREGEEDLDYSPSPALADNAASPSSSGGIDTSTLTFSQLSASQRECIQTLQQRLRTAGEAATAGDVDRIVRFAVARNFDVEKSADMLLKHCQWRREVFPIRYSEVYDELRKGKYFFRGVDKEGRPVLIARSRLFDPKVRMLMTAARSIIYIVERRMRQLERDRKAGKTKATQLVVIYDREGFSPRTNLDNELIKLIATQLSSNYPETLFRCMIYPTGWLFRSIWSMLQYFFDPKTRAKVLPLKALAQLQDYIAEDQLMKEYGGKDDYQFDAKRLPTPEEVKGKEEEEVTLDYLKDGYSEDSTPRGASASAAAASSTSVTAANTSHDSSTSSS